MSRTSIGLLKIMSSSNFKISNSSNSPRNSKMLFMGPPFSYTGKGDNLLTFLFRQQIPMRILFMILYYKTNLVKSRWIDRLYVRLMIPIMQAMARSLVFLPWLYASFQEPCYCHHSSCFHSRYLSSASFYAVTFILLLNY